MKILYITAVATLATICHSLPMTNEKSSPKCNYASRASKIIAANLLRENVDNDVNHVFSPLGISTVLAILSEGAKGETRSEIMKALGYPEDQTMLRESYTKILENLRFTDMTKTPSFKTWFYVYKNNTAKEDFKQILRDYYFVEVKDVERTVYDWSEPNTSHVSTSTSTPASNNSKDILDFDDLKSETFDETRNDANKVDQSKFTVIVEMEIEPPQQEMEKESSKFDKVVEDKQYVEVPVIKEEIAKEQEKQKDQEEQQKKQQIDEVMSGQLKKEKQEEEVKPEKKQPMIVELGLPEQMPDLLLDQVAESDDDEKLPVNFEGDVEDIEKLKDIDDEENETIKDEEKIEVLKKELHSAKPIKFVESNEPEKIVIPLKELKDLEIVQTIENHFLRKRFPTARTLFMKDDVASALSANSLVGDDAGEQPPKSQMLLFNGLYYRGNWAYPFQQLRKSDEDVFYVSKEKSIPVTMMKSHGNFRIAELEELQSQAVEFPYENNRYSLLAIVPKEREGLRNLIENLKPEDLDVATSKLAICSIEVRLPKFCAETTSRSEEMLKKLGLKTLFSKNADLRCITEDQKLYVDELVQHVNVRVDEGSSSENFLTAANTLRSANEPEKVIIFDRPFIYFVRDNIDDHIIAAGKVVAPELQKNIFPQ